MLESEGGFSPFPAAIEALEEFGGVVVDGDSDSATKRRSFNFVPTVAVWERDRFDEAAKILRAKIYPLGEFENGHAFIAIDEHGQVYLLMGCLWFVGSSMPDAIVSLVGGQTFELIHRQEYGC